MEKEELLTLVNEEMGSTQLTLSEETINGELEDALTDFVEGADHDALVARLVSRLKRMEGNLHKDVSTEVNKYKANLKKGEKKQAPKKVESDDEPAWFAKYREEQEARIKQIEESRRIEIEKANREKLIENVKKGLRAKFEEAGVSENTFIFKQTFRDIEITENSSESSLVKEMEKAYYKNLKEAGIEAKKAIPGFRDNVGGKGDKTLDAFFAKKGAKEGWKTIK